MLTVVALGGKNSSRHVMWKCVCECGNVSTHTGNNLNCGHTKSCGCLRHRSRVVNLTGQKFGRLTVQNMSEVKNGVVYWNCVCECGRFVIVPTGHLKSGHTKSCGCLQSEISRKLALKHIAGKKKVSKNGTLPKRICQLGYVRMHDNEHPRSDKGGFVFEHIWVYEKFLGRMLVNSENIHHINGNKSDNRIENLELWDTSQPPGQRKGEKAEFYLKYISSLQEPGYLNGCNIEELEKAKWVLDREIKNLSNFEGSPSHKLNSE